jgi:hypothetical protein
VVIDQMARAVPRLLGGKIMIRRACDPGIIGPETKPCRMRKPISDGRLQEMPHRNEAMVNRITEATKVFTTP